jgi:hypothetical protein
MELLEHFALGELEAFEALFRHFQAKFTADSPDSSGFGSGRGLNGGDILADLSSAGEIRPKPQLRALGAADRHQCALDYLKTVRPEASLSGKLGARTAARPRRPPRYPRRDRARLPAATGNIPDGGIPGAH